MAVGVAEIDGMRDFVILELEFDAAPFQFFLSAEKVLPIRAQREMKHADVAADGWYSPRRIRPLADQFFIDRKQRERGCAFADENGNAVPHSLVPALETENVDVPLRGTLHVAHT